MGRGASNTTTAAVGARRSRGKKTISAGAKAYEKFRKEHLRVVYLQNDKDVRAMAAYIKSLNPSIVALDVETASKTGKFGALNGSFDGSLRTIQLGFDEPEKGIEPLQVIIDCHRCSPQAFLPLLRTRNVEKQIQFMDMEQSWALTHLGISIGQIYDTCVAGRLIRDALYEKVTEAGLPAAQAINPKWKPKKRHYNDNEEDKKLRKVMEEAGMPVAQKIFPGWRYDNNKLATLTQMYLGLELPKENQTSDWSREVLDPAQTVYAAMDVATLPELTKKMKEVAERLGISEQIDGQIQWIKGKIAERVDTTKKVRSDDVRRLTRAFKRASSRDELDRVFQASKQMTVLAENASELTELYNECRKELSA